MNFVVAYLNGAGEPVGYLSRNGLVARQLGNAAVNPTRVSFGMQHPTEYAGALLKGPHPLDHHDVIKVAVLDVDDIEEGA